jgi:hypothetical protein
MAAMQARLDNFGWAAARETKMKTLRYIPVAAAALVLIGASLIPDDAFARGGGRGGGGARAGGFHGGAARAGGFRGGAVHAGRVGGGGYRVTGGVRPGYVGRPIAGRPGYGYRGGYYGGRGLAYGAAAAAAGAAAYGAYGAYNNGYYNNGYNNGCYYDANGQWVCANQYPYRY